MNQQEVEISQEFNLGNLQVQNRRGRVELQVLGSSEEFLLNVERIEELLERLEENQNQEFSLGNLFVQNNQGRVNLSVGGASREINLNLSQLEEISERLGGDQ